VIYVRYPTRSGLGIGMAGLSYRRYWVQTLLAFTGTLAALLAVDSASAQDQQSGNLPTYSNDLGSPFQASSAAANTMGEKEVGTVATSSVGTAGQRLTPTQGVGNTKPAARIETRIANRVESRIRNRIDRYYDPQANSTSPFKVASDKVRAEPNR